MGLEDKLPNGILLTNLERFVNYSRSTSLWPATFGLACCAIEMMATGGPRHDIAEPPPVQTMWWPRALGGYHFLIDLSTKGGAIAQ